MGDGAEWIRNLTEQHFPSAVQIVDLYQARQQLWDLARKLHPNDETSQRAWVKDCGNPSFSTHLSATRADDRDHLSVLSDWPSDFAFCWLAWIF